METLCVSELFKQKPTVTKLNETEKSWKKFIKTFGQKARKHIQFVDNGPEYVWQMTCRESNTTTTISVKTVSPWSEITLWVLIIWLGDTIQKSILVKLYLLHASSLLIVMGKVFN